MNGIKLRGKQEMKMRPAPGKGARHKPAHKTHGAVRISLDAIKNAASSADDYVRENPWIAIGVIAGVSASLGFLAGYMAAPQRSFMGMLRR